MINEHIGCPDETHLRRTVPCILGRPSWYQTDWSQDTRVNIPLSVHLITSPPPPTSFEILKYLCLPVPVTMYHDFALDYYCAYSVWDTYTIQRFFEGGAILLYLIVLVFFSFINSSKRALVLDVKTLTADNWTECDMTNEGGSCSYWIIT